MGVLKRLKVLKQFFILNKYIPIKGFYFMYCTCNRCRHTSRRENEQFYKNLSKNESLSRGITAVGTRNCMLSSYTRYAEFRKLKIYFCDAIFIQKQDIE